MTIYSIVNNLIKEPRADEDTHAAWTLVSPAGILQGGNPFFVPDFARCFEARIALAVRIGKLGKSIAPRFVHRYVDAVAPCVLFIASDLLSRLRAKGLPWSQAISYDRCLAIGKFIKVPPEEMDSIEIDLSLQEKDGERLSSWNMTDAFPGLEKAICSLSRDNTLKTGDIILLGIPSSGEQVAPGMRAVLSINDEISLKFNIR